MPLDPKQLPPYYTQDTTPVSNQQTTRLTQDTTQQPTDGTNLTVIYPYTIPANTFENDGDTLEFYIAGLSSGSPTSAVIGFKIGASTTMNDTSDITAQWQSKVTMVRVNSNTLNMVMEALTRDILPNIVTASIVHTFTNTLAINWQLTAPTTGSLTAIFTYINKTSATT